MAHTLTLAVEITILLLRIVFSLVWALIAGSIALIVTLRRTNPAQKLQQRSSAAWGGKTKVVTCAHCQTPNESDRAFCYACGNKLSQPGEPFHLTAFLESFPAAVRRSITASGGIKHPTAFLAVTSIVVVLILLPVALRSPSSSSRSSEPSAQSAMVAPTASIELKVFNYGYRRNEQSGWDTGYLTLAYENTGSTPVRPFSLTITGGEVTTDVEKTYPVELYKYEGKIDQYQGSPYKIGFGAYKQTLPANIQVGRSLAIPPKLPTLLRDGSSYYVLRFGYAQAAQLQTVVLRTSLGTLTFPLAQVPEKLAAVAPDAVRAGDIVEFAKQLELETEKGSFRTEHRCARGRDFYNKHSYAIPYTLTNKDKYDNTEVSSKQINFGVYYPDGNYVERPNQHIYRTLGPGQSASDYFTFAAYLQPEEPGPLLLVYYGPGDAVSYHWLECKEKSQS
jgi:hypothetical protein